jgi:hypothetical protein
MSNIDFGKESKNYEKLYKVPMWVVIDDSYKHANELKLALEEAKSRQILWPTTVLGEVIDKLKNIGYDKFFRDYPRPLSDMVMIKLFTESCAKTLNPRCKDLNFTDVYFPYSNEWVKSSSDYYTHLNDVLDKQDDILLSFIFDTKNSGTKVYWSNSDVNLNLIQRLSVNQMYVSNENYRTFSVKALMEEIEKQLSKQRK